MDSEKYIGRLLDNRYEILEVIGTGGMAVVYKARCHRLNRLVAIKILRDDLSEDMDFRRRFHAESQAVAMLSHPNIMSVYDTSVTEEADYIVMELIEGITLKQYMEKKGVLNWKETLHFGMQIAKALEHAHSRGIVHRDIKPHNVMVLKNGSVKVTDFGIARIMSKSNTLTKEALGSVHYISPEQARGGRVDNRSDLYSLGIVMYEMMTGRPPYDGETPVAVAIQHINGGAQMPSVLNPNIPGGLEQIIVKCMNRDPAGRYTTATELLNDLEEFRKDPGILFDFGALPVDEVTRLQGMNQPAPKPAQPRTTAERVAARNAQRPAHQNENGLHLADEAELKRRQEQRRLARQQREELEEKRNKTMTTAVAICSGVAVIALLILLVVLYNGGMSGDVTTVPVPTLLGQIYKELDTSRYPNFEIVLSDYNYSDEYEHGIIMDQTPKAGDQVAPGTQIKIWVSMGPKEKELPVIENLKNMTEEAARNYLDALDGKLVPIVRTEHSDEVEEGRVTRTEPAAGEPLTRGQTVTIYISAGPEQVKKNVPNVIGANITGALAILNQNGFEKLSSMEEDSLESKGQVLRMEDAEGNQILPNTMVDVKTEITVFYSSGEMYAQMPDFSGDTTGQEAMKLLSDLGFKNVEVEEEYHEEIPAGNVIRTNIPAGTKVDVTASVVLTLSSGPEPTEPPTESIAPPLVTKEIVIYLPQNQTEPYTLTIMLGSGITVMDGKEIQPGTETITVAMTGTGVMYYEIYINGEYLRSEKVDFSA
ncbi:MAG: Stk1 family PASTA domain-containing Ser/Thr kinase [Oscillospiraceae bacterium]|nr:Stk1 family PASTA domain-containing Ser/Thr kinase [Oscillospiraceae bacterium]